MPPLTSSQACGSELPLDARGSTTPRLFTAPAVKGPPGPCGCGCALTPETSYGFDVIDFATQTLSKPPDPWQQWALIHLGELTPDGVPRFRKVVIMVARQNGKTWLATMLTLYWLYVDQVSIILGTSTQLKYALEPWKAVCQLASTHPVLRRYLPRGAEGIRKAAGEQEIGVWRDPDDPAAGKCRYLVATANAEGGRSLTIDRAILDELRQHYTYDAWDAVLPAQNAVADAQMVAITNAGTARSVVLHDQRKAGLAGVDDRLGWFEWSAPDGVSEDCLEAILPANPNAGYRLPVDVLLSDAAAALADGGGKLAGFKTEVLCQYVPELSPAIDAKCWDECKHPGSLADLRRRVVTFLDLSPDGAHATLVAAATDASGRVRVEVAGAWKGADASTQCKEQLPGLIRQIKPVSLGFLANGPAASLSVWLRAPGRFGCRVVETSAQTPVVCMGLAEAVRSGDVLHSGDDLLDAHLKSVQKKVKSDRWVFSRVDGGHCDGAYAVAGAVHLARETRVSSVTTVVSTL